MIIRSNIGFRGLAGGIDFASVDLATGAPGTEVTFDAGVLTIPRGADGAPAVVRTFATDAEALAFSQANPDAIVFSTEGA